MIKDLLPIGSVVLLKNAEKRLMICGIKQKGKEDPDREYDYFGIFYPEGNIGEDYQFLFDHSDIDKVFFRGFDDIERQTFVERLDKFYQSKEAGDATRIN